MVDFGLNWELSTIFIGILGHAILFGTGYLFSVVFGGHRLAAIDDLTLWTQDHGRATHRINRTAPKNGSIETRGRNDGQ